MRPIQSNSIQSNPIQPQRLYELLQVLVPKQTFQEFLRLLVMR